MKPVLCLILYVMMVHGPLSAQLSPVYETELQSGCDQVFVHNRTGIPLFKTAGSYVAIHPETFATLWEFKRQGAAGLSEATSNEGFADYFELPATTITYIGNSFVNMLNGEVLADGEADGIRRISSFHLFPAKDLLVVKVAAKGAYRLYGFDPVKNTLRWKTDIDNIGPVSLAGITDNDPVTETRTGLKPYVAASGDLIYVHKKDMLLLDPDSGALKWSQSLEPGIVMYSESGTLIAVAERRTGLGAMMDLSGGNKFGKKLVVVDALTGENAWKKEIKMDGNIKFMQPYGDGFIVAHDEGFNIYDFKSAKGESRWKKDFAAKDISDIVEDGNDLMIYYKDRRMLIDGVTGDDKWKKAEKLAKEVPVFTGGQSMMVGDVEITRSGSSLRFVNKENDDYEVIPAQDYLIDPELNKVYATYVQRNTSSTGLVTVKYFVYLVDLATLDIDYKELDLKSGLKGIDIVKGGFFIHGFQSYYLCRLEDSKLKVVKYDHFPMPGSFGRGLLGAATFAGYATASVSGGIGAMQSMMVGSESDYNRYVSRMNAAEDLGNVAFSFQKRATAPSIDKDFAFFFSRDDDKNLALFQIKKEDASETARYLFDDKTPVYEIDYVNGNLYYMNGKNLKIFRLKV